MVSTVMCECIKNLKSLDVKSEMWFHSFCYFTHLIIGADEISITLWYIDSDQVKNVMFYLYYIKNVTNLLFSSEKREKI